MSAEKRPDESEFDSFLWEAEKSLEDPRTNLTDFEWKMLNHKWDEHTEKAVTQMHGNPIWNMLFKQKKDLQEEPQVLPAPSRSAFHTSPSEQQVRTLQTASALSIRNIHPPPGKSRHRKSTRVIAPTSAIPEDPKTLKQRRLNLFKFLSDWDTASFGKRDRMIVSFIREHKTTAKVHDSDQSFINGGSLIFCRFAVGMEICNLKARKVWHYYEALSILVRTMQGDRYTEEFLRLGGMNFIINIIRGQEVAIVDKLYACNFLLDMMDGRNGHIVKQFICASAHFLETLIDSLTMCKDKSLIDCCGNVFQLLCIEIPPENIPVVFNYIMHAIPCDFNPLLQSMAFKVLQGLVRLKLVLGTRCIKPILDNLKTGDKELLIEMSNLSLVILQTKYGDELIKSLMVAAEGIRLKETFITDARQKFNKSQPVRESATEMRRLREKREKSRAKQVKMDHFMHQAGALFVLNKMMTSKAEFVNDFVSKGVVGLSLKTLGSSPHWEVQGQGVTMVQFLYHASVECAQAYRILLPQKMITLILEKPEVCLRYFTSPICVYLRKLGRFALRMWGRFEEKVIVPSKVYTKGGKDRKSLPSEFFESSQMANKIREIFWALTDLIESPVMEGTHISPRPWTAEDEDDTRDFLDSDDDEKMDGYNTGIDVVMGDDRYEPFRTFMDDVDYRISEDRLDQKVDVKTGEKDSSASIKDGDELDAYQIAILEDEARKNAEKDMDSMTQKSSISGQRKSSLRSVGDGLELEATNEITGMGDESIEPDESHEG